MKGAVCLALLICLLTAAPTIAGEGSWDDLMRGGGVVVDHQPHNVGGLASDTDFLNRFGQPQWNWVADDFVLAEPAMIQRIRWWGFYHLDNPPPTEVFRIRVYSSRPSDGLPDITNIEFEQQLSNPQRTPTGRRVFTGVDPDEYLFEATLLQPVSLAAGETYWLEVVQLGDQSTAFRWEFSLADQNGQAFINESTGDWTLTTGIESDTAFQLISVPEPSTLCFSFCVILVMSRRSRLRI